MDIEFKYWDKDESGHGYALWWSASPEEEITDDTLPIYAVILAESAGSFDSPVEIVFRESWIKTIEWSETMTEDEWDHLDPDDYPLPITVQITDDELKKAQQAQRELQEAKNNPLPDDGIPF